MDLESLRRSVTSGAAAAVSPEAEDFFLRRGVARALLITIQAGYLAMYGGALSHAEALEKGVLSVFAGMALPLIFVLAMCGVAVRLYLMAAVGLDHPATGVKFRRLFIPLLALDAIWAAAPLLLVDKLGKFGWLMLGAVAALVYLPFCQRTLIQCAYRSVVAARTPVPGK